MSSMLCTLLALTTPKINWQVQIGCLLRIEPNGVTSRKIHGVSPKNIAIQEILESISLLSNTYFHCGEDSYLVPCLFFFHCDGKRATKTASAGTHRETVRLVSKILRKNKALFRSVFFVVNFTDFLFFFFFHCSLLDLHCLGCRWCALQMRKVNAGSCFISSLLFLFVYPFKRKILILHQLNDCVEMFILV